MKWVLIIDDDAKKKLSKIPKAYARLICKAIDGMIIDPYFGDVKRISEKEEYLRRSIGSYRILYKLLKEKRVVYIFDIKRRTSKTY